MNIMMRPMHIMIVVCVFVFASGCGERKDLYVYSMVAKTVGKTSIEKAAVQSKSPAFVFMWGNLGEGGWKQYSDIEPREALREGVVTWEINGFRYSSPFTIGPPPPDMVERIRTSGVEVNGHVFTSELQLMFEINPDQGTANVFWYESKLPPLSPPKS